MQTETSTADVRLAASRPAIVEYFGIEGLYGYRTVSLSSRHAATVLIARNGSGKTTLLAALDAFLRGQFTRFAGLQFTRIVCNLRGCEEPLVLLKEDVEEFADISNSVDFAQRAKAWEVEPLALLELLEGDLKNTRMLELYENPTFKSIIEKSGFDPTAAKTQCERLAQSIIKNDETLHVVREKVRRIMSNIDVVYLPTYRRIELSLPSPDSRRRERRKNILSKLGVVRSGLYAADIQFGLGDISERLRTLNQEILFLSNRSYGKISADVINDLISGNYKQTDPAQPPTRESLEIFFSRIKDAEREYRRAPFAGYFNEPDLDRVYSDSVPEDARAFLNYFLAQLNSVIKETQSTESLVEAFINNCNSYLSGSDSSADEFMTRDAAIDEKRLRFNRRDLSVIVESTTNGQEVPLESLSSGEKQMISLFARLYLYPGQKIILIDEPEISLSLDWQRRILPDVLKAPNCGQVVAITHSPFTFDNELEPFASSLNLRLDSAAATTPPFSGGSPKDQEATDNER